MVPFLWRQRPRVFAHSGYDAILAVLGVAPTVLMIWVATHFGSLTYLDRFACGSLHVFLICTHYQCSAHNFIHNPFFRISSLNMVFSIISSLALGIPQTLYRFHHLNHHKYGNDRPTDENPEPRDRSSTYRFTSKTAREEHIVRYSLLSPLRGDIGALLEIARRQRCLWLVGLETAALVGFWTVLLLRFPTCFLSYVVPIVYLGQVSAYAENFLEHHNAIPGDRLTDSVSCYDRLYNWLWFNNGYHQEHHYRPNVHWTRIKDVRSEMMPDDARCVVRGAHWFNLRRLF